jgi:hypothetical protein
MKIDNLQFRGDSTGFQYQKIYIKNKNNLKLKISTINTFTSLSAFKNVELDMGNNLESGWHSFVITSNNKNEIKVYIDGNKITEYSDENFYNNIGYKFFNRTGNSNYEKTKNSGYIFVGGDVLQFDGIKSLKKNNYTTWNSGNFGLSL